MTDAENVSEIEGGGCNSDSESDDGLEWKRSVTQCQLVTKGLSTLVP